MIQGLISENIKPVIGKAPVADIFNGDPVSDYVNGGLYGKIQFLLTKGVGTTGTATLTVLCSATNAGSSTTAIAFKYRVSTDGDSFGDVTAATTSGFTTTAGSNQMYLIEVDAADLTEDKPFVALKMTETVDDPCVGAVSILLANPRYAGNSMPSAL